MKLNWDAVGASLSGLCILHCILMPLLVLVAPAMFAHIIDTDGITHYVLYFLVFAAGVMSLLPGYRLHRHLLPFGVYYVGFNVITYATFFAHSWGHDYETVIAIVGSLLVILSHWLNHNECAECTDHFCEKETQKGLVK